MTECENVVERELDDAFRRYIEARDVARHRLAGILPGHSREQFDEARDACVEWGLSCDRLKEALLRARGEGVDALAVIAGGEQACGLGTCERKEGGMSLSKGKAAGLVALGTLLALASCAAAGLATMAGLALLGAVEASPGAWLGCSLLMLALKLASGGAGVTVEG